MIVQFDVFLTAISLVKDFKCPIVPFLITQTVYMMLFDAFWVLMNLFLVFQQKAPPCSELEGLMLFHKEILRKKLFSQVVWGMILVSNTICPVYNSI